MIILEGLDATGKSTLAQLFKEKLNWEVVTSEGPEKFPGEILKRCDRYMKYPGNTIYDRHPIISQQIYSKYSNATPIPRSYMDWLKARKPIIVYASPENKGEHHIKPHDTPEHLKMIEEKRFGLEREYLKLLEDHFPTYTLYNFGREEIIVNAIYKQIYGGN